MNRGRTASHPDAYARAVLVREFVHERRSAWVQRVSLGGRVSDPPAAAVDHDTALDLRAAVAALPARQRATLVLRFFCDLNVDQSAEILGCSPGTVKSQTARALDRVRKALGPAHGAGSGGQHAARRSSRSTREAQAMIESQVRALFADIADGSEPAPSQTDIQLARRRGRARLRWRRACEFGAHPPINIASLFRDHLRLLGANPANWTRRPIG